MEVEILTRGKPTHPNPVRRPPSGSPWPAAGRRRRPGRGLAAHGCAWPRAWRPRAWPRAWPRDGRARLAVPWPPAVADLQEREREILDQRRERETWGSSFTARKKEKLVLGKKGKWFISNFRINCLPNILRMWHLIPQLPRHTIKSPPHFPLALKLPTHH